MTNIKIDDRAHRNRVFKAYQAIVPKADGIFGSPHIPGKMSPDGFVDALFYNQMYRELSKISPIGALSSRLSIDSQAQQSELKISHTFGRNYRLSQSELDVVRKHASDLFEKWQIGLGNKDQAQVALPLANELSIQNRKQWRTAYLGTRILNKLKREANADGRPFNSEETKLLIVELIKDPDAFAKTIPQQEELQQAPQPVPAPPLKTAAPVPMAEVTKLRPIPRRRRGD